MDQTMGLPEEFEFYGLGKVTSEGAGSMVSWAEAVSGLSGRIAYGFEVNAIGEIPKAVLIVSFEPGASGLDESACAEMGNIIAARMSSRLNPGGGAMISPPIRLTEGAISRLSSPGGNAFARTYRHATPGGTVEIRTHVLLPAEPRESHA